MASDKERSNHTPLRYQPESARISRTDRVVRREASPVEMVSAMFDQIDSAFTKTQVLTPDGLAEAVIYPNHDLTYTRGVEPWTSDHHRMRVIQYRDPDKGGFTNLILFRPSRDLPSEETVILRLETNSGRPADPNHLIGELVMTQRGTHIIGSRNVVRQSQKFLNRALASYPPKSR